MSGLIRSVPPACKVKTDHVSPWDWLKPWHFWQHSAGWDGLQELSDISTGAAASVSPHKSNVTKCYQINSRCVSFLIVRDLEVPLDLLQPDLHGLVVKVVHLPPVKAHRHRAVRSLPRLYWGADNLFAWTYTVRSYKSCKGIFSIISYYCDNSL